MLKRFTLLACCLLLISQFAIAQSDTLRWHPGIKLKLSDFSIDPSTTHIYADEGVHYEYTFRPTKFGRFLPIIHSYAVLNRKTASLPDSNQNTLRYAQLLFDLSAYQSRLIKLKVFELGELDGRITPVKNSVDNAIAQANDEIAPLKKNLIEQLWKPGNEQALTEWETKVADLLQKTPDVVEEQNLSKLQLGAFIGVTRSIFTGKTSDYFTDATGMNLGFNVDVKKSRFGLDMNLDFNKTKQDLEKKGYWPAKMKTHFASIEITYGIKIPKKKWLSVPFAGFAVNEFSPAKSEKGDKRRLAGYSPVIGFEINRYFGKQDNFYESTYFFYKLRASVNPSNLIRDYGGTQFNLKLAFGFDASKVKSRMARKM